MVCQSPLPDDRQWQSEILSGNATRQSTGDFTSEISLDPEPAQATEKGAPREREGEIRRCYFSRYVQPAVDGVESRGEVGDEALCLFGSWEKLGDGIAEGSVLTFDCWE